MTKITALLLRGLLTYAGALCLATTNKTESVDFNTKEPILMTTALHSQQTPVIKRVLKNGLTVLVRPNHMIPQVSLQIWYNVGSKDEKTGEKGIAHLIEHMIFKGTDTLSESDINELTHKLSGVCNAFTSYDYTGYLFDVPTQNWKEVLPVIADCMVNTSFKDDHLNSEMKAVIQELKMRRDNYVITLASDMLSMMFPDHPYHYPIIGFKQDLWSVNGADLRSFYKKHYATNNAALVVVGDVDPEEVFTLAQEKFGHLNPIKNYTKEQFYWNEDIASKCIKLYRDVQQPIVLLGYALPGSQAKQDDLVEILTYVLGSGKTSRLYRKIVDELHLATTLEAFTWEMFEHSMFMIYFEPSDEKSIDAIIEIIHQEIDLLIKNGIEKEEIESALKKAQMKYYRLIEDNQKQAYEIGKYFWATGDENYAFKMYNQPIDSYQHALTRLCELYLRPTVCIQGTLLPIPISEKKEWQRLQQLSDDQDKKILSKRERTSPVEAACYAHTINANKPVHFNFPQAQSFTLDNGFKVLTYNNDNTPKINIVIDLKAKSYFDPIDKQGLASFTAAMMNEGSKNYTATQLATELESRGINLSINPGMISMSLLKEDLPKALELLQEILTNATFPKKELEKVRAQIVAEIKSFWDEPKQFAGQIVKEKLYANHPFSKNSLGNVESIKAIQQADLVEYYKKYISPSGATIAIVGDISQYDIPQLLSKTLGTIKGPEVADMVFPPLTPTEPAEVHYPINRDQVILYFAGLSIDRTNPDYDKLLIFDQIFGGGVLGSMASRLFELREQSGLFYTISGSLVWQASEQPGMVAIKTIVSVDRLAEAEKAIKQTVASVIDTLTEDDIECAKQAIINSLVNNFESNSSIAQAFLFLNKYKFSTDYFNDRAETLNKITLAQVQEAARKILRNDKMLTLKVGRTE